MYGVVVVTGTKPSRSRIGRLSSDASVLQVAEAALRGQVRPVGDERAVDPAAAPLRQRRAAEEGRELGAADESHPGGADHGRRLPPRRRSSARPGRPRAPPRGCPRSRRRPRRPPRPPPPVPSISSRSARLVTSRSDDARPGTTGLARDARHGRDHDRFRVLGLEAGREQPLGQIGRAGRDRGTSTRTAGRARRRTGPGARSARRVLCPRSRPGRDRAPSHGPGRPRSARAVRPVRRSRPPAGGRARTREAGRRTRSAALGDRATACVSPRRRGPSRRRSRSPAR